MESSVFLFYPIADVPASNSSLPSSSPAESGQSVMSSTSTSLCFWDCHGPIVSSGFASVSGLGFEVSF
jgi:hypothetical protein